jgi:hypothetical protein
MFYVFYLSPLALNTPIPAKWNIYLDIDSTWWNICLHNSFRRGTAALIYYDFHPNSSHGSIFVTKMFILMTILSRQNIKENVKLKVGIPWS